MKASHRQQLLLLDLQELDNTAARLRRRLGQLPERAHLAALQGEMSSARDAYMTVQRELDAQNADIARLESDIELVRKRRQRDTDLLAGSTSAKEAQSLQGELDTLARRQSELEDRELELMEENEATQARFDAAAAVLSGVDARRAEISDALAAAERELAVQVAATTQERAGLAAELQRDILDLYEGIRGRSGIGAARLRGNVSEGSNMALAPAEILEIRAAAPDEIVFCPGSGAILVRVADEE